MAQVVTRVEEQLLAEVDALVEQGIVASRSEAVRWGLARLVDEVRRRHAAETIVAAYERAPQASGDVGWSDESTKAMIAQEPW